MKKGFTLIELLVVVLIIGILSSVALPQYQKSVDRAKGVEALTAAKAIADAENIYFMANGEYVPSIVNADFSFLDIELPELKNWDIGTDPRGNACSCFKSRGCDSSSCDFIMRPKVFSSLSATADLMYSLENSKIVCRCCSGAKCQNYFGVKSGEEF